MQIVECLGAHILHELKYVSWYRVDDISQSEKKKIETNKMQEEKPELRCIANDHELT